MKSSEYFGLLCAIYLSHTMPRHWNVAIGLVCLGAHIGFSAFGK